MSIIPSENSNGDEIDIPVDELFIPADRLSKIDWDDYRHKLDVSPKRGEGRQLKHG